MNFRRWNKSKVVIGHLFVPTCFRYVTLAYSMAGALMRGQDRCANRRMINMFKPAYLALLLSIVPQSAVAQPAPATSVDSLLACLDTRDPGVRLICYDREARAVKESITARDVIILDRAEVRRTRRSLFGFSLPSMKVFGDRDDGKSEVVTRLETKIISVRRGGGYGLVVMKLAEGGEWQTIEANRDFLPSSGESIVIKRGPLGNYNANVAGSTVVRVKRVN